MSFLPWAHKQRRKKEGRSNRPGLLLAQTFKNENLLTLFNIGNGPRLTATENKMPSLYTTERQIATSGITEVQTFEAMFRLSSLPVVLAHSISEMSRRWIRCTWLQGSSNKHAHCSTETFPFTCSFYGHYEVCIEKNPSPRKVTAIIFQKERVLTEECSFNL